MRANPQAAKEAERSAKDALMSEDAGRVRRFPSMREPNIARIRRRNDEDDSDTNDSMYDSEEEREDALARCRDTLQDGVPTTCERRARGGSKPSTPARDPSTSRLP